MKKDSNSINYHNEEIDLYIQKSNELDLLKKENLINTNSNNDTVNGEFFFNFFIY